MKKNLINPKHFHHDQDSNFEENNGAYIQDKKYSSANNETDIVGNLIDNLLKDANNIAKLASLNSYMCQTAAYLMHLTM